MISWEDVQGRTLVRRPEATPEGNGSYLKHGASRKAGVNTSLNDAGWEAFRGILGIRTCKAAGAGKRVVGISPAYPPQECRGCGERVPQSLSGRTPVCPSGGLVLDRDANAALTSLRAGQAPQARTWSEGTSVA